MTAANKRARPDPSVEGDDLRPWASASTVLSVLEQVAREANSGQEPTQVLHRVVSSVVQHGPWNTCWAGLIDVGARRVDVHADAGFGEGDLRVPLEQWDATQTPSWQAISSQAPYILPDALNQDQFPLVRQDAEVRGFRSVLIVPLFIGQDVGVIWFCTRRPRKFTENEIAFAQVVASLTSVALSNADYQRQQQTLLEHERRQTAELRRLNDLADQQYRDLARLSRNRSTLLAELVQEGGLEGLAAVVGESLGTEVLVIDRFGHPLVIRGFKGSLDEYAGELVASQMSTRRDVRPDQVDVAIGPLTVVPIHSGETRLGYLCCALEIDTVDPIATDLLIQASLHMALELVKERVRLESHTRLFGDFVAALTSEQGDPTSVERAATAAGISVHRPIRVFRGRLDMEHSRRIDDLLLFSRHVHRLIGEPFTESVIVPAGERELLMLVQWPDSGREPHNFTADLRRGLNRVTRMLGGSGNPPTAKITVGVGSLAVGPAELRRAEQEARQSLEVADAIGIRNVDVDLQSLGSYSLLTALGPAEADAFADRYLGPVRRYDAKHGSDLAETVTAYVDTGGSIAATAERLHIHASTLKYRLKRVQELTGMSLAHPEHRLSFALACRIVRLRKVSGN